MLDTATQDKSIVLRIAQSPLTRLVVLGTIMFFLLGTTNGFMAEAHGNLAASLGIAVGMVAVGLAVYSAYAHFVERRSVSELALPGMGKELAMGLLIGAGLYTGCILVLMLLGIYRIEAFNPVSFLLTAVPMAIRSSFFEELLFRGVLFRDVENMFGSWVALAVSSLVFGLVHLMNPAATVEGALFIAVEAGVLLGAAYLVTQRLWMSIGFHASWNYTQEGIFSGIVSGGESDPGFIKPIINGPDLLTGGNFGVESSLIAFLLCTTTGVILIIMAVRQGKIVPPFWKRSA
jgi:membrane protease YdiL (CAAX protease family)